LAIALVFVTTLSRIGFSGTIWDGGGGSDTFITNPQNWDGNQLPDLDGGTADLTFGTAGIEVIYEVDVSVSGIILNRAANFEFLALEGNLFSLGSNGIQANPSSVATVTYFFSDPVTLSANQTWTVQNNLTFTTTLDVVSIGGGFNLTKNGSGTLALNNNSTRSDASSSTTLNAGILRVQAPSALNTSTSAPLFLNGGELRLATNTNTSFNGTALVIGGNASLTTTRASAGATQPHPVQTVGTITIGQQSLVVGDANIFQTTGNAVVNAGAVTLTGLATFHVINSSNADGIFRVPSITESGGARGFTKSGNGTLEILGASTYTGTTTLVAGTLGVLDAGALGSAGNITFAGGVLRFSAGAMPDISARIRNSASAISIDTNGENATFASPINATNTSGITKFGNGTLTLSANNTFNGTTTVRSGTLRYGVGGRFEDPWGADSNVVVGASTGETATFEVSGGYFRGYDFVVGDASSTNATIQIDSGELISNHNVFIANNSTATASLAITGGSVGWVYGLGVGYFGTGVLNISGGNLTGDAGASPAGQFRVGWYSGSNGTLNMSGGNLTASDSYIGEAGGSRGQANITGGLWTTSGNLSVGVLGNATLGISGTGRVVVGGTLARNATRGVISLQPGGTLQIGSGGANGTLATDLSNNGTLIFDSSGTRIHSNLVSGSGALMKNGTGSLTLSANNTYTGATLVNAGTLFVTGNLSSAAAPVNVAEGAVLGGSGSIGRVTTINGTLAPGNNSAASGVLAFTGNVTLRPNATTSIGLNGTTRGSDYDGVNISGTLTGGGNLSFHFSGNFLAAGQNFTIFNATQSIAGFASVQFTGSYGSGNFTSNGGGNWTQTVGSLNLTFSENTGVLAVSSAGSPPTITSAASANGSVGTAFSYQTTVTPLVATTYNASGLPAGLGMNSTTGLISGTPALAGNFSAILSATNSFGSSGNFSLSISVVSAYDEWASDYGLSGSDALPASDPDGDSFTNRQEYAFGTSPTLPTAELLDLSSSGGNLTVSFSTRPNQDYSVQTTYDLANIAFTTNATLTDAVEQSENQSGVLSGYIRMEFTVTPEGSKNFYRVEATDPPSP
jgi:autotransporter-associated beta strand protein/T5SS/PEP-CTERM-associated repeat protein